MNQILAKHVVLWIDNFENMSDLITAARILYDLKNNHSDECYVKVGYRKHKVLWALAHFESFWKFSNSLNLIILQLFRVKFTLFVSLHAYINAKTDHCK